MVNRVRNSANPCVRDMPKYLRTRQMSVHGYPVDKSIFCNLQLDLLKLQEDCRHAPSRHRSRQCISCWRAARCSWSRNLIPPCSRAPLLGDNMRFSESWHDRRGSRDASGRRFPNPSASRGRIFCGSWNRLLCSMLVMFLRGRCWLVGAFAQCSYSTAKRTHKLELTSHCLTSDWQLKHCDTLCSIGLYREYAIAIQDEVGDSNGDNV